MKNIIQKGACNYYLAATLLQYDRKPNLLDTPLTVDCTVYL